MITLILYHGITKNSSSADEITHYYLIKLLYEKKVLDKVVCLKHDLANEFDGLKIVSISRNPLYLLINKLFRVTKKIFSNFQSRYYLEVIFDHLAWQVISRPRTTLVYSSKPALPFTFEKCKTHKINVILRASVAHPLYNYYIVKNEEQKYGLRSSGSYSNIRRANRLTKCFHLANKVMVNTVGSEKEYLSKTFLPCFAPDKIIPYRQLFVTEDIHHEKTVISDSDENVISFIHVAHMNLIKGTHYLLEAWKTFQESTEQRAELLLIGSVDSNLKNLLRRKKLYQIPNAKFLGFQKNPFAKFQNATAFVSSSLSDLGPATILEALSHGIPVITSENCGLSNIIENEHNGFSYQFNDVQRLAGLFSWFTQNQEKMTELRIKAKETAQKFSRDRYEKEIWPIIKEQL